MSSDNKQEIEKSFIKNEKKFWTYPNVMNVFIGNKYSNGTDTGKPCIVFYVSKKYPKSELKKEDVIPETIDGMCTDVIELNPIGWEAGKTEPSQLPYDVKKRIGGGVID